MVVAFWRDNGFWLKRWWTNNKLIMGAKECRVMRPRKDEKQINWRSKGWVDILYSVMSSMEDGTKWNVVNSTKRIHSIVEFFLICIHGDRFPRGDGRCNRGNRGHCKSMVVAGSSKCLCPYTHCQKRETNVPHCRFKTKKNLRRNKAKC